MIEKEKEEEEKKKKLQTVFLVGVACPPKHEQETREILKKNGVAISPISDSNPEWENPNGNIHAVVFVEGICFKRTREELVLDLAHDYNTMSTTSLQEEEVVEIFPAKQHETESSLPRTSLDWKPYYSPN